MPITDVEYGDQPYNRLTQLCATMMDSISTEENNDVRAIIFLSGADPDSDKDGLGGISTFGYEDVNHAIADLLLHLRAMFQSQGQELNLIGPDGRPLLSDGPPGA